MSRVEAVSTLVMVEGDYLLEAAATPAINKLVAWKEQIEGAKPITLGEIGPGHSRSYLSKVQLAATLLRK